MANKDRDAGWLVPIGNNDSEHHGMGDLVKTHKGGCPEGPFLPLRKKRKTKISREFSPLTCRQLRQSYQIFDSGI